jgi:hypothetical protein
MIISFCKEIMKVFLGAALWCILEVARAQVNVCMDGTGKKTYTEAKCEKIGLKDSHVISDIKPLKARCYDLQESADQQRKNIERLRRSDLTGMNNMATEILTSNLNNTEMQYEKECVRK